MFDPGNFVTIGIVLVILVVYRLLDRDNRSLEKVKKYADKLRDDMNAYADKRLEDLKAYAIDLDVHQKSSREILRQVQNAEKELETRAAGIADIAVRLGEYDKALAELKAMSGRVDENLRIIHEESAFVDGLAKSIKIAHTDLGKIQSDIPGIREEIKAQATNALGNLLQRFGTEAEGLLASARKEVESLETKVEQSSAGVSAAHGQALKAATDGYRRIEDELAAAFKRAHDEGVRLEDETFAKLRDQIDARGNRLAEAMESKFGTIKENVDTKAAKLNEALETRFNGLRDLARDKVAETQGLLKNFKAEWRKEADDMLLDARTDAEKTIASLNDHISEAEAHALKTEEEFDAKLAKLDSKAQETAGALHAKIKDALKLQQEDIVAKQADIKNSIKEGLAATKDEAENAFKTLEGTLQNARTQATVLETEQKNGIARIESTVAATEKRAESLVSALNAKFTQRSTDMESRVLEGLEARSKALRDVVEQGLERLEASRLDIGKLEKSLHDSMNLTKKRVEHDFSAFAKDISTRHETFEAGVASESTKLQLAMRALDEDLNSLKSHAYADVSEKLKVFEDEFFADLRKRREEADEKFIVWRNESDERLSRAIHEADEARAETEKLWLEESRTRAGETQARVGESLEKLAAQVDAHRQSITERVTESAQALSTLKATIKADLDEARGAGSAFMNAELERWKHDNLVIIGQAKKDAAQGTALVTEELKQVQAEFKNAKERAQAELEKATGLFEASLKKIETEQKQSIDALSAGYRLNTTALGAEWAVQREQIVEGSKAERESIGKEIRNLGDSMERLRQEMSQKSTQALSDFGKAYDSLTADSLKKVKESSQDMDKSLTVYRQEAKVLADTLASSRDRMVKLMEDDRKEREQTFAEMDKQVKAFQAQTRLFERSDELKQTLSQALESMKSDIGRLDARKAEMTELETQYTRIKRMEDELNQKIGKFLAEKRRIDAMEEDFNRLLGLSQAVDQKLSAVTASNDQLTQIQAEMRRLSAASDEAEQKYERVEKKAPILDATADAVDKNFQALTELERNVRSMDADIKNIPERIIQLKRSLDEVLAIEPKLTSTMDKLDDMDKAMNEAEKRVTELQKAREWLARAETRFEELNKKTNDHLKLLNDILKDEPTRKDKNGAPPLSVQESVRKLSHQGWKVDEIARVVKLSRGEVELILELSGDK